MNTLLRAGLACLAAVPLLGARAAAAGVVPLDVEFKLTDKDYAPLAGVPVRPVLGAADWQAPDAGVPIVTAADGTARFTTEALVDRRLRWSNVGFTPLRIPFRSDHIWIAAELAYAIPKRGGGDDTVHHWLYTADIDRDPGGDCSTDDIDKVYEPGADGRFNKLVGTNGAGPNFHFLVDGLILNTAGYKLWDFMLSPPDAGDGAAKHWHLKLGVMRLPKPRLPDTN